jgi:DNA-binding CsgD family transcriptional regulator
VTTQIPAQRANTTQPFVASTQPVTDELWGLILVAARTLRVGLVHEDARRLAVELTPHLLRLPYARRRVLVNGKTRRQGDPTERGSMNITLREKQVLIGAAHGLTCKQIAFRLGISMDTVKTHLSRVYTSMDARNAAHAVALGFKHGLIEPSDIETIENVH